MGNDHSGKSIIDYLVPLLRSGGKQNSAEMHAAEKIRTFIDEIPGGFLIYRADGGEDIIYANKALLDIFKCDSFKEFMLLTDGTFRGLVHPDDFARVKKEIRNQICGNNNGLDYVEYRIIRKDGMVRWVEDYGHYITGNSAGDFFYVFITDATEKITKQIVERATLINNQTKNEQKLQNIIEEYDKERKLISQEHLQRLEVIEGLSINYDSIIYANIEENIALPYRLSTRLIHQFTKKLEIRPLDWFLDEYVNVWVHPDDRAYVKARTSIKHIQSKLSKKNTYYINYRCIQNGEVQYIQLRLVNVSVGKKVAQIVMGYRNIDEEVLTEMRQKQLLEAALQNAKKADVAKNTFLSNMSHDMRTPLNAIFGYIQLARKAEPNGNTLPYLEKIETAGKQILDLVDKVLELSYSGNNEALNEEPFHVTEVLKQAISQIQPQAAKKNISISLNTDALTDNNVIGDKKKLSQILINIIDNAVKYTKKDGKVDVTVTQKTGLLNKISSFTFEVEDNGIGISKPTLECIFDPFIRESNSTESGVFGAGLGLTIVKQMVDAMHGTIRAESTLGEGSTFTVTLGLKPDLSEYIEEAQDEPEDFNGKKILIVEDNEINLEIETEILSDYGFIIDSAENGKIAVDKIIAAGQDGYDLILMDIQMPIMDGRTATREIRGLKGHPLSGIPIIALSANAFESDRRESIEAGMDSHINKPLDVEVLLAAIRAALKARKKK